MSNKKSKSRLAGALVSLSIAVTAMTNVGCTSLLAPMKGVPASHLPPEIRGASRNNLVPLPLSALRQRPPQNYLLDSGDILGIYIEGIMPPKAGENQIESAPPVHFPEAGSDLPPSVGYPIPVREDGTLALPLISPINVKGKSLAEAEELIKRAYVIEKQILKEGRDRILVSLMRERTYRVIVVREDRSNDPAIAGGDNLRGPAANVVTGTERSGSGYTLDLPAYKNDLMHALAQTGGLPGLNAKNEVKILKARYMDGGQYGGLIDSLQMPMGDCNSCCNELEQFDPTAVRIPLRLPPGVMPAFRPEDIILEDGDIVVIEARDTEVFYTGGLLPGGQFPIPRDYDLDVFGAMAIAGQGIGGMSRGVAGGGPASAILGGGFGGAPPTQLYVIRKTCCGDEVNIAVDVARALNDPSERLLIQPGDTLILRYKPKEEVLNFSLVAFFTVGIRELLR